MSTSVSFSPDGTTLASGSSDDTVSMVMWDVVTHENIATLEGHTNTVRSVSFSPDGTTLASGSSDEHGEVVGCGRHAQISQHFKGIRIAV